MGYFFSFTFANQFFFPNQLKMFIEFTLDTILYGKKKCLEYFIYHINDDA